MTFYLAPMWPCSGGAMGRAGRSCRLAPKGWRLCRAHHRAAQCPARGVRGAGHILSHVISGSKRTKEETLFSVTFLWQETLALPQNKVLSTHCTSIFRSVSCVHLGKITVRETCSAQVQAQWEPSSGQAPSRPSRLTQPRRLPTACLHLNLHLQPFIETQSNVLTGLLLQFVRTRAWGG